MKFEKVLGEQVKAGDKIIDTNVVYPRLINVAKATKCALSTAITIEDSSGIPFLVGSKEVVLRLIEKEVYQVHWFDLKVGDALESTDDNMMLLKVASLGHNYLTYKDYGNERSISLRDLKDNGYAGSDLKFNVIRKVNYDIQTQIG